MYCLIRRLQYFAIATAFHLFGKSSIATNRILVIPYRRSYQHAQQNARSLIRLSASDLAWNTHQSNHVVDHFAKPVHDPEINETDAMVLDSMRDIDWIEVQDSVLMRRVASRPSIRGRNPFHVSDKQALSTLTGSCLCVNSMASM